MFIAATLNLEDETSLVYVIFLNSDFGVYLSYRVKIALLKVDKVFTLTPSKNIDFANIFSSNLVAKLLEYTGIKNHINNLIKVYHSPES